MTPKEKGRYLVEKFIQYTPAEEDLEWHYAVKCSIIAVDEIIEQWEYIDTHISNLGGKPNANLKYWQEVKSEIEKL